MSPVIAVAVRLNAIHRSSPVFAEAAISQAAKPAAQTNPKQAEDNRIMRPTLTDLGPAGNYGSTQQLVRRQGQELIELVCGDQFVEQAGGGF